MPSTNGRQDNKRSPQSGTTAGISHSIKIGANTSVKCDGVKMESSSHDGCDELLTDARQGEIRENPKRGTDAQNGIEKPGETMKADEEDEDKAESGEKAGHDEPDRASVFSLFMEKDFRYYFQHPYFRLMIAYLVTVCNFVIYAEDPVAHSNVECFIPVVGNCFAFICSHYPHNAWALLKVVLWLLAIVCGLFVGKLIVHKLIFNRLLKLKMFLNDQGSWMTMFFTTILCLFIFSWIYNGFLMIGGESTTQYMITSKMGIKNSVFMKAAACGTWCGDLFTAWMVTDIMLQDNLYPHWAKRVRKWWNAKYHRIILFWITIIVTSTMVVTVISTDWINWDTLNRDFLPRNELARGFLASFILVLDLVIVMQDWDFPHFINYFDIKLPGLNTAHIKFRIPKCLRKKHWVIHISGKWFNYGIIFFVMILDLNMWKNQIFYEPYEYGQYVDKEGKIHTVKDLYSLDSYNRTYLTYEWRRNNTDPLTNKTYLEADTVMNSRYYNIPLKYKALAFMPSLMAFVSFGLLISYFGRWKPTPDDPHAGRLKKRKRQGWLNTSRRFFCGNSWRNRQFLPSAVNLTKISFTKEDGTVTVFGKETNIGFHEENDITAVELKHERGMILHRNNNNL